MTNYCIHGFSPDAGEVGFYGQAQSLLKKKKKKKGMRFCKIEIKEALRHTLSTGNNKSPIS